ncbi:hypothetical protein Aperf_G00000113465 [Anoplocephala perfoliata]
MALSCGGKFLRILLIIYNVFSIVDGALVIIYAIALLHYLKGSDATRSALASVAAFLVAGIAACIIGFLGCCGALRKKASLLRIYAGIIFLLVVANIICLILLISFMDDFKSNTFVSIGPSTENMNYPDYYDYDWRDWYNMKKLIIGMVIVYAIFGFGVIAAALVVAKQVDSGKVSSETKETSSEKDFNMMG